MDTNWLEDFLSLSKTNSFSRSAKQRQITQPAFSRRIQALEKWAGVSLIDRSNYPTRLTDAGKAIYPRVIEILQSLEKTRNIAHEFSRKSQAVIDFVLPRTLASTFFPSWMMSLQTKFGSFRSRVTALPTNECITRLTNGEFDLFIGYSHSSYPLKFDDSSRMEKINVATDRVVLCSATKADGGALFQISTNENEATPFLSYSAGSCLHHVSEEVLARDRNINLNRVCEADMATSLKAMVLQGLGVAFLPMSLVAQEMEAGKLVSAVPTKELAKTLEITLQLTAYRRSSLSQDEGHVQKHKEVVDQFWSNIKEGSKKTGSSALKNMLKAPELHASAAPQTSS